MSNISVFNKQVSNFLDALYKILPDNKDIYIFQTQLETMSIINKKLLVDNFIKFVYPYKGEILKKDEHFFLGRDLGEDLGIEENQIERAIHLKKLWKENLTDENKEVVWKYFQVMIVLAERIVNK
jgi:hypothetical protein